MSDQSPNLEMPFLLPSQAQKHVTHNEALQRLDALVQLSVLDHELGTPPVTPQTGDRYIVPVGATGVWAGQAQAIAYFDGVAWLFLPPRAGWRVLLSAARRVLVFESGTWQEARVHTEDLEGVGVNTHSDAQNRLSVSSPSSLFSHDGAGHQLKINKSAEAETASLLFQDGWSGRAEMGLTGSDDWALKVSEDGLAWSTLLQGDASSGTLAGSAVQATPQDTTAGRLMRADFGYGPGNVVGTVAQTSGVPTGAIVERGLTADGDFIRWADGTQICTHRLSLGSVLFAGAGSFADPYRTAEAEWTFPAPFLLAPQVSASAGVDSPVALRNSVFLSKREATKIKASGLLGVRLSDVSTDNEVFADLLAIGRWF